MKIDTKVFVAFIIISFITIILLVYAYEKLIKQNKLAKSTKVPTKPVAKEPFCSCEQMRRMTCNNTENQTQLYETGALTENTDLGQKNTWYDIMPESQFEERLKKGEYPYDTIYKAAYGDQVKGYIGPPMTC
jgi:hypothetical protein